MIFMYMFSNLIAVIILILLLFLYTVLCAIVKLQYKEIKTFIFGENYKRF